MMRPEVHIGRAMLAWTFIANCETDPAGIWANLDQARFARLCGDLRAFGARFGALSGLAPRFPSLDIHDLALLMAGVYLDSGGPIKGRKETCEAIWRRIEDLLPTVTRGERGELAHLVFQHGLKELTATRPPDAFIEPSHSGKEGGTGPKRSRPRKHSGGAGQPGGELE